MNDTKPILCGKCHVPIKVGTEADGETLGACPVCGQQDRMDDIIREAAKYRIDKMVRGTFSDIQSSSFTVKSPPEPEYRWITGD
jgi:hypothetical protein